MKLRTQKYRMEQKLNYSVKTLGKLNLEDIENTFKNCATGVAELNQALHSKKFGGGVKVPPNLCTLAYSLSYHQKTKAYEHMRKAFENAFPSSKSLRNWSQFISGEPGFLQEALRF